jgi:cytochrome P450
MTTSETVLQVTTLAGDTAWQVTGYANVKALLGDPRLGRSHPAPERAARYSAAAIFGQPMGSPETERSEHAHMRSLLTPSFSASRMANLRPRIQELVDGLLDVISRMTPPLDFHALVSLPLPVLVICELLGVPYTDREDFRRWSDDAVADESRRARHTPARPDGGSACGRGDSAHANAAASGAGRFARWAATVCKR